MFREPSAAVHTALLALAAFALSQKFRFPQHQLEVSGVVEPKGIFAASYGESFWIRSCVANLRCRRVRCCAA